MAAEGHFSEAAASVDAALSAWRQGDFLLGPQSFLKRLDPTLPLVRGEQDCDADSDIYEQQVDGLVVVTQTCDIVRAAQKRPYVEVCPLVRIENAALMEEISKCRRPAYAVVPGSEAACLVADLDRTMTVEKPVVAKWDRRPGCRTDDEARRFAAALARKRSRFPFPDDFCRLAAPLVGRAKDRHGRDTDEGRALSLLREIRVRASPSWAADAIRLFFWFIAEADADTGLLRPWCVTWMSRIGPQGGFASLDWDLVSLDDLSAREYVESDQLDLEHLSDSRSGRA